MRATTIEGQNAFALRKFHVTDSQNMRDQITNDRRSKGALSNCVLCIPFILRGSPNECCLHTCDACVITTGRLGLWAPLVARNCASVLGSGGVATPDRSSDQSPGVRPISPSRRN